MKNLGLALINLPRLEDIICQKTSGLPWWPGQGGREVGGGDPSTDPSSARLHLESRAARSGVLTTGTPRDLLWADCWPVVLGTGLELVHQRAQDISPALTRLFRKQSQDAPGPKPHCSRMAPPHAPSAPLSPPPGHGCPPSASPSGGSGSDHRSPLAAAGPAPPWISTAPQPPQRPSQSQAQTQTPAPMWQPPSNSSAN